MNSKSIVITGVSTGIGQALAKKFLQQGCQVFGSVRKQEDAKVLQDAFPDHFTPLIFDVTDEGAISKAVQVVEQKLKGKGLDGVINNAGIAEGGPLQLLPMETIRKHFEINVMGVIAVTRAFLPLLGAQKAYQGKPGKIINVGSTSGKLAYPYIGPYTASKHALEAITHSWRRELKQYGIDVILVSPGMVKTPIWDKGIHLEQFEGTEYESHLNHFVNAIKKRIPGGYSPEYLADKTWKIFNAKNPKTRYALVAHKFTRWTLPRILPDRWLDNIVGSKK